MSGDGITPGLGFGASEERKVVPYQRQRSSFPCSDTVAYMALLLPFERTKLSPIFYLARGVGAGALGPFKGSVCLSAMLEDSPRGVA